MIKDIHAFALRCHKASADAGWWARAEDYLDQETTIIKKINLMHSELGEATEADRKNLESDHLPGVHGVMEELADFAIRAADLAGYALTNGQSIFVAEGRKMLAMPNIPATICMLHKTTAEIEPWFLDTHIKAYHGIFSVLASAEPLLRAEFSHSLEEVIELKLAYNLSRADHKIEAREAAGGKAY